MAAGLALAAAALAAAGPYDFGSAGAREQAAAAAGPGRHPARFVTAAVRIADAETVRLLRPGDRVDVIAAPASGGDASRVVAGARVSKVLGRGGAAAQDGALVVLSVPRPAATELAGAGVNSRLAVVVC
ncbi:hypothetical protein ACFQVC_18485 [Streptomyces monticola]|uniref:Flp pilus assembly protein RcpC/CpaB domain-containing protein n=1 Tax=Streptomyces monticola TaxID=2666263 RepID=A0ABW2JL80_9ACTN